MKYLFSLLIFVFSVFSSDVGFAAEGELDWTNFTYRVINFILVLAILYYAFGKKMRAFFIERRATLINDFDSLKNGKEHALMKLAELEESMLMLRKDQEILAKEQHEKTTLLCQSIIEEANKTAEQIILHAQKLAQIEILQLKEALLEEMAEQIVVDVTKHVSQTLSKEDSVSLLKKSLSKVVCDAK